METTTNKTNMWKVTLETRKLGALGVFEPREFVVRAEEEDVVRYAIEDAAHEGYEARFALEVKRIPYVKGS